MNMEDERKAVGMGELCLGKRPLSKEPLTKEDWAEVRRAYLAFQHHMKLIVMEARKRVLADFYCKTCNKPFKAQKGKFVCPNCGSQNTIEYTDEPKVLPK